MTGNIHDRKCIKMCYLNNMNAGLRSKEPIFIAQRDAVGSNPALYCYYPQRDTLYVIVPS